MHFEREFGNVNKLVGTTIHSDKSRVFASNCMVMSSGKDWICPYVLCPLDRG